MADDLRRRIMIELGSDTQGVADRLAEEIERLKRGVGLLTDTFASGNIGADQYMSGVKELMSAIGQMSKELQSSIAAQDEWAAMQDKLREMNARTAQEVIENGAKMTASYREGLASVRESVEEIGRQAEAARRQAAAQQEVVEVYNRLAGLHVLTAKEIDQERQAIEKLTQTEQFVNQVIREDIEIESERAGRMREREVLVQAGIQTNRLLTSTMQGLAAIQAESDRVARGWAQAMHEDAQASEDFNYRLNRTQDTLINAGAAYTRFNQQQIAMAGHSSQMRSKTEEASFALLHMSHALQDLQYGFGAIVNNIPLVTQSLGGMMGMTTQQTTGLAGAIMIIGTAANVLYNNWDKLKNYFELGIPRPILDSTEELTHKLKENKKEFEDLAKQSRLSLVDLDRYKHLNDEINASEAKLAADRKERQEEDRWRGIKSKEQGKVASGVQEALAESGGYDAVSGQLAQAFVNYADRTGEDWSQKQIDDRVRELLKNALGGSKQDRDYIRQVMVENLPQRAQGFAKNLTYTSPEFDAETKDMMAASDEITKEWEKEKKFEEGIKDTARHEREAEDARKIQDFTQFKWQAMKGELEDTALRGAATGKNRVALEKEMTETLRNRLVSQGLEGPAAHQVGQKLATQGVEKAFADMLATGRDDTAAAAQEVLADMARAAADKAAKADDKAAKAAGRAAKAGDKAMTAAEHARIAGGFQAEGLDAGDASDAASQVEGLLKRTPGLQTGEAMQMVFAQIREHLIQIRAQEEQMQGYFGEFSRMLAGLQMEHRVNNFRLRQAGGGMMRGIGGVNPNR